MRMNELGTITQMGRILQVNNAMVTEVFTRSRVTGYISIIYSQSVQDETISEPLRLNASFYTDVLNPSGQHICLCDIQEGMLVDALFSPIMEWRIPPQANAYLIVAREYGEPSLHSTTAQITEVDMDNFVFYTYDPDNPDNQIEFNIAPKATVRDKNGYPVPFRTLYPGLLVNVVHSEIETEAIPYRAIAFHIQIL